MDSTQIPQGIQYDIHWAQTETMRERCDQCPALEDSSVSNLGSVWVTQEPGNGGVEMPAGVADPALVPPKMAQINQPGFTENRAQVINHTQYHSRLCTFRSNRQSQLVPLEGGGHGPFSRFWRQSNRAFLPWEEGWDPVLTQRQGS